jgi:hypothetical protein
VCADLGPAANVLWVCRRDDDRDPLNVTGRDSMPRIRITTDQTRSPDVAVVLDERIATSDLDSDHFAASLVERIGWALADADDAEGRLVDKLALQSSRGYAERR